MSQEIGNNTNKKILEPRLWEKNILPGYFVVAVDQRVPEYPEDVEVERGVRNPMEYDLRSYLVENDPHYRRFLRLAVEAGVASYEGRRFDPEFTSRKPFWFALTIFDRSKIGENNRKIFGHMQAEAKKEPEALKHLLN